jgi:hypothetical protein
MVYGVTVQFLQCPQSSQERTYQHDTVLIGVARFLVLIFNLILKTYFPEVSHTSFFTGASVFKIPAKLLEVLEKELSETD